MQTLSQNKTIGLKESHEPYMMPELPAVNISTQSKQSEISWADPIPFEKPLKEHIDLDCLPKAFADMCMEISASKCVSTDFVAGIGLGILSLCTNRHYVSWKDGSCQPLCLFVAGIAEPGEGKSPVVRELKKPIDAYVEQMMFELRPQIAASEQKRDNLKTLHAIAKKAYMKNPSAETEAETIRLAQELDAFKLVRLFEVYTDDTSTEKMARLLQEHDEVFSICTDEGGIFDVISGSRTNTSANYGLYCNMFSGHPYRYDRVNAGSIVLSHPVGSIITFVQPIVAQNLVNNVVLKGVGFVDRFLIFRPPSGIGKRRMDTPPINPVVETNYRNMVFRLLRESQRRTLRLSKEAREQYYNWYHPFEESIPLLYDGMKGWASKFETTVVRIAGMLQLADDGADIVSEKNMVNAICLSDYFAEQARRFFQSGDLSRDEQLAVYILERINKLKDKTKISDDGRIMLPYSVLKRNIHKKELKQKRDYAKPLQALIDRNYIDVDDEDLARFRNLYINPKGGYDE